VLDAAGELLGFVFEDQARSLITRGLAEVVSGSIRGIREKRRAAREVPDLSWTVGCRRPSALQMQTARERHEIVGLVVGRLGSRDALLVRLRYANELTFAEIGRALGICEDAAFRAHGRMLERAREGLASMGITGMGQI
jgi:DNA-directed RNA polymerase specialized sigma24 family protein